MTYHYHIPIVYYAIPVDFRRGLAVPDGKAESGDVSKLGCGWWYNWGCLSSALYDARYVPMSWAGDILLNLPKTYSGYLLALNEPDNPYQANLSPGVAVQRCKTLQATYPDAKLIIGGLLHWGTEYLQAMLFFMGSWHPHGWHVHGYVEPGVSLDFVTNYWLANVHRMCQGEIWLTEFADVNVGHPQAQEYLDWVKAQPWITRYAWFASKVTGLEPWYPQGWPSNPTLMDENGMTATGKMYTKSGDVA